MSSYLFDLDQALDRKQFISWAKEHIMAWDQANTPAKQLQSLFDAAAQTGGVLDSSTAEQLQKNIFVFTPARAYQMLLEKQQQQMRELVGPGAAARGVRQVFPLNQHDEAIRLFLETAEQVLLTAPTIQRFIPAPYEAAAGSTGTIIIRARTAEEAQKVAHSHINNWAESEGKNWVRRYQLSTIPLQADPHTFQYYYNIFR